jgi:transposase
VHARESTFAVFDQRTGELTTRRVVGRPHELLPWLRAVAKPARVVYEAGPTGYGLARRARGEGIELVVCAPSKTERPPADRIKTDKRDAIRLARLLAAGELTLVTIPSVEREQLRDLVRCREDIRVDLMRARHRIGGFLLRREIYWEGPGEAWSRKHRSWLTSVQFADQASQATLADYLHAHDVLIARRDQVEADLAKLAVTAPCAQAVARLRCLRGIDTLSALGLCAEIGEWGRFDHPDQLAAYLGIVPCEHTSGRQRRLGSITKAGSTHARRLLVEAAYHYRRGPAVGEALERRQRGQSPQVINIAWRAQRRLNARWRQLKDARRKPNGIVAVAIARELAAYCWEIATWAPPHPDPVPPASCRRATPSHTQPRAHRSPHQPPARDSPTHADPEQQPAAARDAARAPGLAHNNSAKCRLSSHPPAAALDFRQRTCDEPRSWGTQPPNMSMTDRREPADARTAPRAATTSTTTTNQTMAINPYPLTAAPPYGRQWRSLLGRQPRRRFRAERASVGPTTAAKGPSADAPGASTLDLLHQPAVPVGIVERRERPVVAPIGVKAGRLAMGAEVERLADLDVSGCKLGSRSFDVLHDKVQPLDGSRPLGVSHQRDRAGRPRCSELDDAEVPVATMINVDMESGPFAVERLRAIHVGNRHDDEF